MKGTYFNKPLEWNIETSGEAWSQGSLVIGTLKVTHHGQEAISLKEAGVCLAYAEIKKVHAKDENAFKADVKNLFNENTIQPGQTLELPFSLTLPENCPVSDKKASYYLLYGRELKENHLQLKVEPNPLYPKLIGLLDTFYRFKVKEFKGSKTGIEYKLLPPTSREMANIESLTIALSKHENNLLKLDFLFQVRKLDTSSITTKVNKASVRLTHTLQAKEYTLSQDLINQDFLIKFFETVFSEIKLQGVY
jgi:hypothetical protein